MKHKTVRLSDSDQESIAEYAKLKDVSFSDALRSVIDVGLRTINFERKLGVKDFGSSLNPVSEFEKKRFFLEVKKLKILERVFAKLSDSPEELRSDLSEIKKDSLKLYQEMLLD